MIIKIKIILLMFLLFIIPIGYGQIPRNYHAVPVILSGDDDSPSNDKPIEINILAFAIGLTIAIIFASIMTMLTNRKDFKTKEEIWGMVKFTLIMLSVPALVFITEIIKR